MHQRGELFPSRGMKEILGDTFIYSFFYCSLKTAPWEGQRGYWTCETFHRTPQSSVLCFLETCHSLWCTEKGTRELHAQPAPHHDFMMLQCLSIPLTPINLCFSAESHLFPQARSYCKYWLEWEHFHLYQQVLEHVYSMSIFNKKHLRTRKWTGKYISRSIWNWNEPWNKNKSWQALKKMGGIGLPDLW